MITGHNSKSLCRIIAETKECFIDIKILTTFFQITQTNFEFLFQKKCFKTFSSSNLFRVGNSNLVPYYLNKKSVEIYTALILKVASKVVVFN